MSKKTTKKKKLVKVTKPLKSQVAKQKAKKTKSDKEKLSKKTVVKKPAKEIVKKNSKEKKAVKKDQKVVSKKIVPSSKKDNSKKAVKKEKPLKKVAPSKIASKSLVKEKTAKKDVVVSKKPKAEKEIKSKKLLLDDSDFSDMDSFDDAKKKPKRRKGGRKKKNKGGDDDEPEIMHDELVEQLIRSTKKLRAQPKKPRILKTFTNPMASLSVAPADDKDKKAAALPKKEPKGKFTLEYVMNTSVGILYEFLTSPSGLMEWFADDVSIHDGIFTFVWDGSAQKAKLLGFKENEYVRLQWLDKPAGTFFEFRIQVDKITNDVSLMVTDFADEASDLDTSRRLWDSQMDQLLNVIGSY